MVWGQYFIENMLSNVCYVILAWAVPEAKNEKKMRCGRFDVQGGDGFGPFPPRINPGSSILEKLSTRLADRPFFPLLVRWKPPSKMSWPHKLNEMRSSKNKTPKSIKMEFPHFHSIYGARQKCWGVSILSKMVICARSQERVPNRPADCRIWIRLRSPDALEKMEELLIFSSTCFFASFIFFSFFFTGPPSCPGSLNVVSRYKTNADPMSGFTDVMSGFWFILGDWTDLLFGNPAPGHECGHGCEVRGCDVRICLRNSPGKRAKISKVNLQKSRVPSSKINGARRLWVLGVCGIDSESNSESIPMFSAPNSMFSPRCDHVKLWKIYIFVL